MIDLKESRDKIDAIDEEIVRLFEERMKISVDIADYKIKNNKAVLDRTREEQKLATLSALTHTQFNEKAVCELYEQIMSFSRKYQYVLMNKFYQGSPDFTDFARVDSLTFSEKNTVYYFGAKGSYTQASMEEVFGPGVTSHHVNTFRGVMEAVCDGRADYGVLPIENSSTGGVTANYDSILEYPNAIVGQHVMAIRQCLVGLPDSELSDIKSVYSHPQGLKQCRDFLEAHPEMTGVPYDSTSAAARKIAEEGDKTQAAIAGERAAAEYGLKVLKHDIQTEDDNSTRFIILSSKHIYTPKADKISLCFELPHVSGSLYRVLSHFLFNDLNLTLIESRPIPGRHWEYRFFVDLEGNLDQPGIKNALRGLHEETAFLKILGNYNDI